MNRRVFYLFLVIAVFSIIVYIIFGKSICIFYNIFGVPCLTCGMTRAYFSLLHLNIKEAFHYHPLFLLVPFFLIRNRTVFYILFAIFFIVWLVRLYLYFPNIEPFLFNHEALYPTIFYKLEELLN